ncbi:DUF6087 family protein [Streptomyces sp. NPDC000941]
MEDEPLNEWADRRDGRRPAPGTRREFPLGDGPERSAHVDPDAPRGIVEWDGHLWIPTGVAADHATAAQETGPQDAAQRIPLPEFNALPPAPEPWRPTEVFRRP